MADQHAGIPVMLHIEGWRCLIIGGGNVAARRCQTLLDAGAVVTVIAPQIEASITDSKVSTIAEAFDPDRHVLSEYSLVIVATDHKATNKAVGFELDHMPNPPLVNRADDADAGDLTFMVSHRSGPLTVAVHTGGASASAAVRVRDEIVESLDDDWATLLTHALPARKRIQQQSEDPAKRLPLLRRLTDETAMRTLKTGGESALEALYADIMEDLH